MALVCERNAPHRGQRLPHALGRPAVLSVSLPVSVALLLLRGEGRWRSGSIVGQGRRRAIGRDTLALMVGVGMTTDGLRLWDRARGESWRQGPVLRGFEEISILRGNYTTLLRLDRAMVLLDSRARYRR